MVSIEEEFSLLSFRLSNYFRGFLVVKITGQTLEKFINLCIHKGIYLWDIKRLEDAIIAKIRVEDFRTIRPIIRRAHCKIHLVSRYGFPFFLYRMRYRKMLIAGGVLFCVCLYMLYSFVWFIETVGLISLPEEAVLNAAKQAGLKSGTTKNKVDVKLVEHTLLVQIPEIAWVGVTLKGTKAVIEVAEKTVVRVEDKSPAHIIAAKDGLMEEIIALVGEAAVQRGEMVRQGQLLINGALVPKVKDFAGNLVPVPDSPPQLTHAQGIAKARIWYQAYGESGLMKQIDRRTGRIFTHIVLKVGQVEKIIKDGLVPFGYYETEEAYKRVPSWRNKHIPVESKIITFYEIELQEAPLTVDEAREEAKRMAFEKLQHQIPEGVQVLNRNIEVLKTAETDIVRVKVIVETLEDIGQIQKINSTQ
jgi:similar to stage IV sporulation protein